MRTTDSPTGTLLGDRYLLTQPLGAGASASVYLAEDQSLRREVAVKVLRTGLATDDAFLRRFRAEAVAVAGLNHPHVLRVFDWGEAGGDAWLVMEYLSGGSLRDLLDRRGRLSVEQTAAIGAQAADGLAYAHERGFVHRDVKPGNLLFDDAGRVRIADFGVARALAEAAWTEPQDSLIGTVRYTSPEQAQGHQVDGKSDVYSLALVLYECLTGEVPFAADTQVATLSARIDAPLPFHPALGELEGILRAAAAPDPDERLDAAQLLEHLTALSRALADDRGRHASTFGFVPPSAAELSGQHRAVGRVPVRAATAAAVGTEAAATAAAPAAGPVAAPPADVGADATELGVADATIVGAAVTVPRSAAKAPKLPKATPERVADPPPPAAPTPPAADVGPPRRRRWPRVLAVLLVALAATAAALIAINPFKAPTYAAPLLVNLTVPQARVALGHGDVVKVTGEVYSRSVGPNLILHQEPSPGALVAAGATYLVTVSAGPPPVLVPSVVDKSCAAATAALTHAGFTASCPAALAAYSKTIPPGAAIGVYDGNAANPSSAPAGAALSIQLSKGLPPAPVPGVVGLTAREAVSILQRAGFAPVVHDVFSRGVPAGDVIGTNPGQNTTLQPGRAVRVVVSLGAPATVPSLGHADLATAEAIIVRAGLTVLAVHGPLGSHDWTSQPAAGSVVSAGSGVTLYGH